MTDPHEAGMIRSQEELVVDTVWRPAERVRFTRRVVEEDVTLTVRVQREELHIEREPLSGYEEPGRPDALTGADELVIALREERPVVSMEVVPLELVRVTRQQALADELTFADTVRKERIEFIPDDA